MQYDESIIIPWQERRLDFRKYIQEIQHPSDVKRRRLAEEFVSALFALQPSLIFLLRRDIDSNSDPALAETLMQSMQREYRSYLEGLENILHFLCVGYPDYDTEDKAASFIRKELGQVKLPKGVEDDLRTEFLKIWKINRLGFMYFGDIVEKVDGFIFVHMAAFLINGKIPKEEAMPMLMEQHRSASTYGLILTHFLALLDIKWAMEDLLEVSPPEKDDIQVGGYKVVFKRKRSDRAVVTHGAEFYVNSKKIADYCYTDDIGDSLMIDGKPILDESGQTEVSVEELAKLLNLLANLDKEPDVEE